MSSQESVDESQQIKSFFCHSCQNEFRKNPEQVNILKHCRTLILTTYLRQRTLSQ